MFMAAAHTPNTDREVAVNHSITITAVPASTPGALAGDEVTCTCGLTWRTLFGATEAHAHQAWHAKAGR